MLKQLTVGYDAPLNLTAKNVWCALCLAVIGLSLSAQAQVFISDTFDNPPATLFTYGFYPDGSVSIVNGAGVDGTAAMQISANLTTGGVNGGVVEDSLTTGNTSHNDADYRLSFDLEVNKPNVTGVYLLMMTSTGPNAGGTFTGYHQGVLPFSIQPNIFNHFSVSLADPLFQDGGGPGYDPSGTTFQVGFIVEGSEWGSVPDALLTIDNLQVELVPEPPLFVLGGIAGLAVWVFRRRS